VDALTSKKAVTHHALAEQKKDDCQNDHADELSNSERGWLSSSSGGRIQISCHQTSRSSGGCQGTAVHMICHFQGRSSNRIALPNAGE
jgi:hypothetical protein